MLARPGELADRARRRRPAFVLTRLLVQDRHGMTLLRKQDGRGVTIFLLNVYPTGTKAA
ncbi:MAG: hypothetical protein Kilf2KO_17290 [Rhodospirillales bacterium]